MFLKSIINSHVSKDGKINKSHVFFHHGSLFSINHLLKDKISHVMVDILSFLACWVLELV
jgi:hypothetical protein